MRRFLTPLATLLALVAQASAPVERKFVNSDWGYEATLPQQAVRVDPRSKDTDDVTFRIADAKMDIWFHANRVPSGMSADEYLAAVQQSVEKDFGSNLTLNLRRPGFVAMSWTEGDMIHYRKGIARGSNYARLYMIYPVSKKRAMDPIVTRASRSFRFR